MNGRLTIFGGTNGRYESFFLVSLELKTTGVSLATNDVFVLEKLLTYWQWLILEIDGPKPCSRFGHTLVYSRPFLVLFGGSSGLNDRARSDLW